jgi:2,3-bisphosphoglycerate-independent phosphoglycerate mutase
MRRRFTRLYQERTMQALLVIIDGTGLADPVEPGNAVTKETLPTLFRTMDAHGYAILEASGPAVGLDSTKIGNSEVGHLTIGAGFVVPSMLARIEAAFNEGAWARHGLWQKITAAPRLHIVGLLSDAGTHGHWANLFRAVQLARSQGAREVVVHPVLDGVDSQVGSAPALLDRLVPLLADPAIRLGLVMGRASFCDRSGNRLLSEGYRGALTGAQALPQFTREALMAHLMRASEASFPGHRHEEVDLLKNGEPVLFTQNRADRARQIAAVIAERNPVYSLVELDGAVPLTHVFFPNQPLDRGLPFELKAHGLTSVRIAETCKYPHVTFFLNGLNEDLEGRAICIPSIAEAQIPQHPEMAIAAVTDAVVEALARDAALIVVNLANLDQVGHLGDYGLAVKAAGHVETALQRIATAARVAGAALILTSDHGNADCVVDAAGKPYVSHTDRPVPFTVLPPEGRTVVWKHRSGSIAQIAPTVLEMVGLSPPPYMTESLATMN